MDHVWYFAYGSNLDPDRFRNRIGDWVERRRAVAFGYVLRFSGDVTSEGGGGAIVLPEPGGTVHGAAFRISDEQLAAMDREEFAPGRDIARKGIKIELDLESESGSIRAVAYTVSSSETFAPPSDVYLGHILTGLAAAGHDEGVLESVRAIAAAT